MRWNISDMTRIQNRPLQTLHVRSSQLLFTGRSPVACSQPATPAGSSVLGPRYLLYGGYRNE